MRLKDGRTVFAKPMHGIENVKIMSTKAELGVGLKVDSLDPALNRLSSSSHSRYSESTPICDSDSTTATAIRFSDSTSNPILDGAAATPTVSAFADSILNQFPNLTRLTESSRLLLSGDLTAKSSSSHPDSGSSSSDEELREPMAEAQLNLSDDERIEKRTDEAETNRDAIFPATMTISATGNHTTAARATRPSPVAIHPSGTQRGSVIVRLISRENRTPPTTTTTSGVDDSSIYACAKPRPPPRFHRRQNTPPLPEFAGSPKAISNVRSMIERIDRKSKNDFAASVTSPATETRAPSRKPTHSSGYSSPGSSHRSATTSLSPSSSSASSHSSFSHSSGRARDSPERHATLEPCPEMTSSSSVADDDDENDVFPVSWIDDAGRRLETTPGDDVATTAKTSSMHNGRRRSKSAVTPCSPPIVTQPSRDDDGESDGSATKIVDYDRDIRLPSGNTICLVEAMPAHAIQHTKQRSSTLSALSRFPLSRRGADHQTTTTRNSMFETGASDRRQSSSKENRRSVPLFFAKSSRKSKKSSGAESDYITESDFSEALANLERERKLAPAPCSETLAPRHHFNTVSGATGRQLADEERLRATESCTGSLWSLNPSSGQDNFTMSTERVDHKSSLRSRLKGAFSFQNIRRAISMERVDEAHDDIASRQRSASQRTAAAHQPESCDLAPPEGRLYKTPSISSIISTVRMRKRKSKERRAAKATRNTIAVDPRHVTSFGTTDSDRRRRGFARSPTIDSTPTVDVGRPGHFRPIGRVVQINSGEGTVLVEISKPPSGPFGFYLARRKTEPGKGSVYISSLNDGYPDKMYAGLMKLGDEITEVNTRPVAALTLDQIYDVILDSDKILLRIRPTQVHIV